MKKLSLLFILLITIPSVAQTSWIESDISRESNLNMPKDILPIVNKETSELALFYKARKVIFAKLYNENSELIGSINAINLPKIIKVAILLPYF